jgi:hypothetical protein
MSKQRKPRQRRETVVVQDFTGPRWAGMVEGVVAQFAAVMPEHAPRLVYQRREALDCAGLPAPGKTPRLAVCTSGVPNPPYSGYMTAGAKHDLITLYDQAFSDDDHYRREVICHEMMHALARVPDNYDTNADSCIYGHLDHPGGADIQMLRERYRKKDRR